MGGLGRSLGDFSKLKKKRIFMQISALSNNSTIIAFEKQSKRTKWDK